MSFNYSRPRIKLPKFFVINNNKPYKNKQIYKIIFIICVVGISIVTVIRSVTPVFNKACAEKAKSIATIITNDETTRAILDYKYSDFIVIHKDDLGNIMMLESNMKNINIVTSDIAWKIQSTINNTQEEKVNFNLGAITGINILSGSGRNIPIKISTVGNVQTNVVSSFTSAGINQTLHRLYLDIETQISILTPYNTISESITNQFILAENIIVGEIPDSYYNINGITDSDAMNLMD